MISRCAWAGSDPLYLRYHDTEWGIPAHDDRHLFEMLVLEGAQAGLAWITILRKREGYRKAFDGFDPAAVARYDRRRVARLLKNPDIVRNRLKVESTVTNARAFLKVRDDYGSFDAYIWRFVGGHPTQNRWKRLSAIPAETAASKAMSTDLKRRWFTFVGPTICYAFMQATGMVNDHPGRLFPPQSATLLRVRPRIGSHSWASSLDRRSLGEGEGLPPEASAKARACPP